MAFSASLVTGNTFSNGDSATATKLNNQVNLATFQTSTASTLIGFDGSKNPLDYSLSGSGSVLALANSPTLITPALGVPVSGDLSNCSFPTLNQNTTGTAANVTGTVALAHGGTSSTTSAAANQNLTPATVIVSESAGAATINWASGAAFFLTLTANCTISFSNQVDGQVITVLILNTASNWTVTWPAGVKWASASAPVQTVGAHYDLYSLVYNNTVGATFGTYVQNY